MFLRSPCLKIEHLGQGTRSLAAIAVLLACPVALGEKVPLAPDPPSSQGLMCLLTDVLHGTRLAAETGSPYRGHFPCWYIWWFEALKNSGGEARQGAIRCSACRELD